MIRKIRRIDYTPPPTPIYVFDISPTRKPLADQVWEWTEMGTALTEKDVIRSTLHVIETLLEEVERLKAEREPKT